MEANDFVVRLKANGTDADLIDLHKVFDEYKVILKNLTAKDTGPFSLNVLCVLCRNLDKVPTWRDTVDGKMLVSLSLACLDVTHCLPRTDQVKVIACIYHIHKHVVKLNVSIPPELILKLSYRPFDNTNSLLAEYCKTYWNFLVDRISYVEKVKAKNSISKLLPKISEDALKVIQMYDTVQFCTNILTFLVKKLHYLYNETNAKELNKCFGDIFKSLSSKSDLASFKKLTDKEILDVYTKFNDCFYVIAENASKTKFDNCILNIVVRTALTILGHNVEVMRCLETFFLNGFCSIFENLSNATNIENILTNMVTSSLSIEKLGYEKALYATYPYLNQFLRLFIEISISNSKLDWKIYFNEKIQYGCLNLMLYLSSKKSEQLLKCDNCRVKSGLHDSLRLLFLIKHFPTASINQNIQINNILPIYYKLVITQHKILLELKRLGCVNHEKCFRKLQTDIHNTAITLNKANSYDYSIKLFNIYIEFEMKYFRDVNELKNISRALYNKSICELDCKLYIDGLKDSFLSLIFSLPDGLGSEKYMSLVMDIKAKSLKGYEGNQDDLQLLSILDVCKMCVEEKNYGNLKPFLINLKFSDLLKHEYSMYARLWPSIIPIAGVWRSLYDLMKTDVPSWVKAENEEELIWTLYEVLLDTPTAVRTIHSEYYSEIITKLLDSFDETSATTTELALVQAALLFLKCEYDLAEASLKYEWKTTEPITSMDPDHFQFMRTMPQEHEATKRAIEAVLILTDAVKDIGAVTKSSWIYSSLRLYELFVQQLLHLSRTVPALQLAHNCCEIARHLEDGETFVRTASVLLSHAQASNPDTVRLISECGNRCADVSLQTALRFMADVAIYYSRCGSAGVAARLVQMAQYRILEAHETRPGVNLELAIGRLTEAQAQLCKRSNALSVASGIQRHYLAITNAETKWSSRRLLALTLKVYISCASLSCVRVCRSLLLWRRARCACAACLPAAAAGMGGRLYGAVTNAHRMDDAQTKIDNRLKHILGLQPNDTAHSTTEPTKPQFFTPKHENLETMLEDHVFKKTHVSPSLPCTTILAYKTPDFFKHEKCSCFACRNPYSFIIACTTSGLEASMYFRAKEMDIAKNYFEGAIASFVYAERRINSYFHSCKAHFEGYIVDMVERSLCDDFKSVQIQVLIEAAFFALASKEFGVADDWIVRMHEIIQDVTSLDPYLRDDVMNLMTASAQLRKATVKPVETGLELDMECLKLAPDQEPPKTPINKPSMPPKMVKNIVKPEELPITKRKVIKLNLDDVVEETVKKPTRKRAEFKIPVPVIAKAQVESITPRTRKPDILVTKSSDVKITSISQEIGVKTSDVKMTPKGTVRLKASDVKEASTFFTPNSTPSDQFFTPMTSMKTYSKKSLRTNIVKNLEAEFSTPKADKENSTLNAEMEMLEVPKPTVRSTRSRVDKQMLKRATSPGKLVKEVKPTRSMLRNPKFKVHEDSGK